MSLWQGNIRGNGVFDWTFTFPVPGIVDKDSFVLANIVQVSQPQGEPLDFPFQGDATMEVHNIVPLHDNILSVRFEIDWDSPLDARVQLFVFD
jgi:hypothetical protein